MTSSTIKAKRTRTGCLCCRRRHKKCDEQKPACKFCISKGLECEWPIKGSVFVTYKNTPSASSSSATRPINFHTSTFHIHEKKQQQQNKEHEAAISPRQPNSSITAILDDTQMKNPCPELSEHDYTPYQYLSTKDITPQPSSKASSTCGSFDASTVPTLESPPMENSLPSLTQYHFVIPKDKDEIDDDDFDSLASFRKTTLPKIKVNGMFNNDMRIVSLETISSKKRLSVDSLLN